MFGGWFSDKADKSHDKRESTTQETTQIPSPTNDYRLRSSSVSANPKLSNPVISSDIRKSNSTSAISPHDIAISQMDEKFREIRLADPPSGVTDLSPSSSGPEHSPVPHEPQPTKTRSRNLPENVYDPFDGQSIGLMVPGEFEEAEDDLWTHLAHVRNLQRDIARMHTHMEGLGEEERSHRAEQTVDDETVNVEEEAKAAKAAEFAKLSDRFDGRKDTMDAIMSKLNELSHAINDFHSSRAPVFRFASDQDANNDMKKPSTSADTEARAYGGVASQPALSRVLSESRDDVVLNDSPESLVHPLADHPSTQTS
ncbi:hypothetical protein DFH11DRAFT_1557869 [Phellopilus nigrolimitatus]|nr:hypothetical protein DFH11DRAFT_1557869 [Phellopilus nigrolimitatus]